MLIYTHTCVIHHALLESMELWVLAPFILLQMYIVWLISVNFSLTQTAIFVYLTRYIQQTEWEYKSNLLCASEQVEILLLNIYIGACCTCVFSFCFSCYFFLLWPFSCDKYCDKMTNKQSKQLIWLCYSCCFI